jgi:hypothetical protein
MSTSTRPQRSAAKNALANIKKIYEEYYNDEDDNNMSIDSDEEYTVASSVPTTTTPTTTAAPVKPTLTSITDYKAVPEYDALAKSDTYKSAHVQQIKSYLDAADEKKDNHINVPELMKYLILNPYTMIRHTMFNSTVYNKMCAFTNVMNDQTTTINAMPISDQYRKEFSSLARIVATNTKIHSIINLTQPFYNDIDKIATEYEKAINSFIVAVKPPTTA